MLSRIYESAYHINSFHVVDEDTQSVLAATKDGYISPAPGTRIIFPNPNNVKDKYSEINTIVFSTKGTPLKVQINDNDMYPVYVEPNSIKSIEYMRIYSITVLEGGPFYFEGLSSET